MADLPRLIRMHASDNVAVVANNGGLAGGTEVDGLTLVDDVPQAHKVALTDLKAGEPVLRYGVVIGHADRPLPAGAWVNETNLTMPAPPVLSELIVPSAPPPATSPLEGYTFQGFRNRDGSVGTRNILAITNTVQCVSGVVGHAVERIRREMLPRFANVDNVVALDHTYGCGVAIDAPGAAVPIRTLHNIARNPNFAGSTMIVSLGCEKLQPTRLFPELFQSPDGSGLDRGRASSLVTLQDESHVGFEAMITSILYSAEVHLTALNNRTREACPVSDLVVGMQCGGSDALSGVTANPALGIAADLIVRAGGTVIFSEVTEVRDGIDRLVARAATADVAKDLIREMAWYDEYLAAGRSDRSANTTPGNKKGGLSNIVEKAMGSISKSGSMPISGVIPAGERASRKGLLFAATPASDFICGTLQLAAGMNVHVFTTGRGTPYSLSEVPVVKLVTRTDLARRWYDLVDVDTGRIISENRTLESMGIEIFETILAVASGQKTKAECLGISNQLALFNPGPVT
ncbi:galactarate dehydratase [Roseovarius azorensis]|uniref:Galactarate dehydratase n=1 Tax=Roseovarius azorensis TaxID=1287727 RepID=A0A1H7P3D6_9RHOB|nr:galactarate dehydratase [Roseovarius azorensis]SEL29954.1 galactarate dehydratase [Roseovarius azorensis]